VSRLAEWLAAVAPDDPSSTIDLIAKGGPTAILAVVIILFLRGDIVPRSTLEKTERERDRALDLVYEQAGLAKSAVDTSAARLASEQQLLEIRQREANPRWRS
jgi:hypothetical protein